VLHYFLNYDSIVIYLTKQKSGKETAGGAWAAFLDEYKNIFKKGIGTS
jgi:hypothetical protein